MSMTEEQRNEIRKDLKTELARAEKRHARIVSDVQKIDGALKRQQGENTQVEIDQLRRKIAEMPI